MNLKVENEFDFDLRDIFETVWAGKFTILLSGIVSVFFSILYINNAEEQYKASSVIEIKVDSSPSSYKTSPQLGSLFGFSMGSNGSQNEMIARISGNEFLSYFLKDGFETKLRDLGLCAYNPPRTLSFSGVLDFLGARKIPEPSKHQIFFEKIDCLKAMISIRPYELYGLKSPAFIIEVTSQKAKATALIANELVDKFFEWERSRLRADYKKTIGYLSDEIANAQIKVGEAKSALQQFLVKNASYFLIDQNIDFDYLSGDISRVSNLKVVDLGRLEQNKVRVNKIISLLKATADKSNLDNTLFNSLLDYKEDYSFEFERFLSRDINVDSLNRSIFIDLLREEIGFQEDLLRKINVSNDERAMIVADSLKVSNEFERIKLDFVTKSAFFEEIKRSLKAKSMEIGISSLRSNELHSVAIEPYIPFSPKPRTVVLIMGLIFGFAAILVILAIQYFRKTILSSNQLDRLFGKAVSHELTLKRDLEFHKTSASNVNNYNGLNLSFFDKLSNLGKVGCVVEVGKPRTKSQVGKKVSLFIGKIMAEKNKRVLCVSDRKGLLESVKVFGDRSDFSDHEFEVAEKGKVELFGDPVSTVKNGSFFPLNKDHAQFDKVIIDVDKSFGDITKFDLIEKCEFFILVGQKGCVNLEQVTRYFDFITGKNEKFFGFLLIK